MCPQIQGSSRKFDFLLELHDFEDETYQQYKEIQMLNTVVNVIET